MMDNNLLVAEEDNEEREVKEPAVPAVKTLLKFLEISGNFRNLFF